MLALLLLQTELDPTSPPWATLLNYGLAGIILLLMLVGYMYPKPMVDHLRNENDRLRKDNEILREENTQLRSRIEERVVPALVRVTDLLNNLSEKGIAS